MREVCFILVQEKILRVYFGSATSIPDERERWETIWEYRNEITEIAHSHPGEFLDFSHEDLTTMEAVEAGTGKVFTWSIATKRRLLSRESGTDHLRNDSPWWLGLIRQLSYGTIYPDKRTARRNSELSRGGARAGRTIKKRKDPTT